MAQKSYKPNTLTIELALLDGYRTMLDSCGVTEREEKVGAFIEEITGQGSHAVGLVVVQWFDGVMVIRMKIDRMDRRGRREWAPAEFIQTVSNTSFALKGEFSFLDRQ